MRFLIFLAAFLGIVHTNSALRCYMCLGSQNSDCKDTDTGSKVIQTCTIVDEKKALWYEDHTGFKAPKIPRAELDVCVKLDADDNAVMTNLMERGCGYTYDDVDICEMILATNPAVRNCEWCAEDLCNL